MAERVRVERSLPQGTVTFLFTDIEGSTRLLDRLGPDEYATAFWALLLRPRCGPRRPQPPVCAGQRRESFSFPS